MIEVNFDGLAGPTHNYSGLSYGNMASLASLRQVSSPKQAALQGLKKARALADRGLVQGILPPQMRPDIVALRNMGFTGIDREVVVKAYRENPLLLSLVSSSAFMWTANAATVCPSSDSTDGKVHLTPANLRAKPHRAIEAKSTQKILACVFADKSMFQVHDPVELGDAFDDEGAANHTRFVFGDKVCHFFVYGREALNNKERKPCIFPARQTLEASKTVARINCVKSKLCLFAKQNPDIIDAGVFHNDVISTGNEHVFFYHELSFEDTETISQLQQMSEGQLVEIQVPQNEVDLSTAVRTYLFNSQIVTMPQGHMALVAPVHCKKEESVKCFIDKMIRDPSHPINEVIYFDLLQSMKNGGGPACLRLRVPLTKQEIHKVNPDCLLSTAKYHQLVQWVERHYRDRLTLLDLLEEEILEEVQEAFLELSQIMNLGDLYTLF